MMRSARVRAAALLACTLAVACRSVPVWEAASPDLRTSVRVVPRGDRACVVVDHRDDGCFDGINLKGLTFSDHGGATAYPVTIGGQWSIVRDGVAGVRWEAVGMPVLNADGSRLAYPAQSDGHWSVIVDERRGEPFDDILAGSIRFDATGKRLVYAAQRAGTTHVVVDGVVGHGWDAAGRIEFSPTGDRFAHVARSGDTMMLLVDGQVVTSRAEIGEFAIGRGTDAVAYTTRDIAGWHVIGPARRYGPFEAVRRLAFKGADRLSFIAEREDREAVLIDGEPIVWHDSVDAPSFSESGERWGYIAHERDSSFVYIVGVLLSREENAHDLTFSPGGRRHAYVAAHGDRIEIVDDVRRYAFDLVIDGTLQFVATGSWAALAGDRAHRRLFVVTDGVDTGRELDWSEMIRLADGPSAEAALRSWVAAAAVLEQQVMTPPR